MKDQKYGGNKALFTQSSSAPLKRPGEDGTGFHPQNRASFLARIEPVPPQPQALLNRHWTIPGSPPTPTRLSTPRPRTPSPMPTASTNPQPVPTPEEPASRWAATATSASSPMAWLRSAPTVPAATSSSQRLPIFSRICVRLRRGGGGGLPANPAEPSWFQWLQVRGHPAHLLTGSLGTGTAQQQQEHPNPGRKASLPTMQHHHCRDFIASDLWPGHAQSEYRTCLFRPKWLMLFDKSCNFCITVRCTLDKIWKRLLTELRLLISTYSGDAPEILQ